MNKPCIFFFLFRFLFVGYDMEFLQMSHSSLFFPFVYVRISHVSTLISGPFSYLLFFFYPFYSSSIQDSTFFFSVASAT